MLKRKDKNQQLVHAASMKTRSVLVLSATHIVKCRISRYVYNLYPGRKSNPAPHQLTRHTNQTYVELTPSRWNVDFAYLLELVRQHRLTDEQLMSQIGEDIRLLRLSQGYSRPDCARMLELDLQMLIAVENGIGNLAAAYWILDTMQTLFWVK